MTGKRLRIAIVGGGIIGVTTGLALQKYLENLLEAITIISDRWTPNTTGDVSAGLIFPYLAGENTPDIMMETIFTETIKFFNELMKDPESGTFGISMITLFEIFRKKEDLKLPLALTEFPLYRDLNSIEVGRFFPKEYCNGSLFHTFIAEPKLLLPKLMLRFQQQNGRFITRKVDKLSSLTDEYDLVINCTGINAKYLQDVLDDQLVSVRGQVIRVKAPWIKYAVIADRWYILPQNNCIVLGGTKDKHNYSLEVDQQIAKEILDNCCNLVPSLRYAEKIGDFVGLRPYRDSLRIELDPNNKQIIHNYGHGGSGVTLCWGSALEVVKIVKKLLNIDLD